MYEKLIQVELRAGSREAQEVCNMYFLGFIFIEYHPPVTAGPTMDLKKRLQIANHLVQLDMDGTHNQIANSTPMLSVVFPLLQCHLAIGLQSLQSERHQRDTWA